MKDEFIPYEEALALKELGFDEPCIFTWYEERFYNKYDFSTLHGYESESTFVNKKELLENEIFAPTYHQAFKWFRDKYKIVPVFSCPVDGVIRFFISNTEGNNYPTYEEAELACLKQLIKMIKKD